MSIMCSGWFDPVGGFLGHLDGDQMRDGKHGRAGSDD
jgi:hypothetical protein